MRRAGSTETETPLPPPVPAAAGSHSDGSSPIVPPAMAPSASDSLPAVSDDVERPTPTPLTVHLPGDPTRSATPSSSPELQPALAAIPLRSPDRYQILGEHGRGGIGRVFRAHDRELGREIAIKELISRGRLSEARFLREALITARLEHPGIVPVHEAGRWPDGTPFYAMKLVAGQPLRDLIAERTTVGQRIGLLHHVIAVADAIAYAHGRNIIHRDLKPANVIVGDFGETVVIDWGLAKDLSAGDEPTVDGGPFRISHDRDLTVAGAVLGTPTYMAPEQERGEHVDQRADVFAIGAMLWELCSVYKVPPSNPGLRLRLLRRAGIDRDLIVILNKALAPNPHHRYADAGDLAADLKAFKSGARIAARDYSLLAMFVHWTRRRLTLALSTSIVIALGIAGGILYVRNIALERDRADASEELSKRSQASAESSLDDLTLKHAELLLMTDPSAAVDLLATYHGRNRDQANQIRAEGYGRGVALLRSKPHTDRIRWVGGTRDNAIVSLSTDGTIVKTSHNQTSTILTRDVSPRGRFSYTPSRNLLAYACDPDDVCIWDVLHGTKVPSSKALQHWQLAGIAFSPSGSKLALLSYSGLIQIFDMSILSQPAAQLRVQRDEAVGILFVDDDTLAVGLSKSLAIQLIRMSGEVQTLTIHDNFVWDVSPNAHRIVLGTQHGDGILLDSAPLRIAMRTTLCHDAPIGLKFLPGRNIAIYSCKEGAVGSWNLEDNTLTPLAHLESHADTISVSRNGDYILAAGVNGTLVVIDLETKLAASYRGHNFRLTAITPPTVDYPYFISADLHGGLRAWPLPNRIARVSANVQTRFTSAIFDKSANATVAATFQSQLNVFSAPNDLRTISPHLSSAMYLVAGNGKTFIAYGSSQSLEIWISQSLSRKDVISTGHGSVSSVAFIAETDDFVTAGRDGRLVYWTSNGVPGRIIHINSPIANMVLTPTGTSAVINTTDGAVWRADQNGNITKLRESGIQVTRMLSVPGATLICIAYANGDLVFFDTESWKQTLMRRSAQSIRDIALTPDGRTVAIADNDDFVHVGHRNGDSWVDEQVVWKTFKARAGRISWTRDGVLLALCSDGTIWLYSSTAKLWIYLATGTADLNVVATSEDGNSAAVLDSDGRIISLDLRLARKSITETLENN